MSIVNWDRCLTGKGSVAFSSLEIPEQREDFEKSVAEIRLNNGLVIDVMWIHERGKYAVVLFRDEFEDQIINVECDGPSEVDAQVREIIDQYSDGMVASASGSGQAVLLTF